MIRSKRNQTHSSRLGARRMIAAIVFSATTLQTIATRAEDSMQRLSKPEELARIAPMRAIGLRFAPPKTLSSLSPREDHLVTLSSPNHPSAPVPPLPMPPLPMPPLPPAPMTLPPLPDPDLANGSIPTRNLPSHASIASNFAPDHVVDSLHPTISTASQVLTASSPAVPASMSTPVDVAPSQDRVSIRLGEASGSTNTTNPKPSAASLPTLATAGPSQTRMPQPIKPQTVRAHSANTANATANPAQPAIQSDGTKSPQSLEIKVTKADGITQHTPVRLSFSNDSVTAAPVARSVHGHTVMRSGSEIPVSVRSLAPNSKVLQATKTSQPALVAAVSLDPESDDAVAAEDRQDAAIATNTTDSANPHPASSPLTPTLAPPTLAPPRPAMPTQAILTSRSQLANSDSTAPVNVALVPKQGRVSLASNPSGGMRIVPVESNLDSMPPPEADLATATPAPGQALASDGPSIPETLSDATHPSPAPETTEPHQAHPDSSPKRVEVATPTIMETDTPSTPASLTRPEVAVTATTADAVNNAALEDRPPTLASRPIGSAVKGSPRDKEPVMPRGPVVTTGPLEIGVVPESAPRLEIESQSANEFLVEGKITFIHIVDPNVCRTVASDGKIFVVGNELGETSIALRTAESTEPIFVRVAVVTPWQNAKQGVADIDQLRATIANVAPEARLRIQPQSDGSLWVIGTVDSNDKAKRVMELTRKLVLVPVVDKLEVR